MRVYMNRVLNVSLADGVYVSNVSKYTLCAREVLLHVVHRLFASNARFFARKRQHLVPAFDQLLIY